MPEIIQFSGCRQYNFVKEFHLNIFYSDLHSQFALCGIVDSKHCLLHFGFQLLVRKTGINYYGSVQFVFSGSINKDTRKKVIFAYVAFVHRLTY